MRYGRAGMIGQTQGQGIAGQGSMKNALGAVGGGGQVQFPQNPNQPTGWSPANSGFSGANNAGYSGYTNPNPDQPSVAYGMAPAPNANQYRFGGQGQNHGQRNDWLGKYGYGINERPFEFDDAAYKNPYMQDQLGMVDARIRDVQGRGDQWGADQRAFAQTLQDRAMGNGPSVAEQQLQRTTDKNIAQQVAMGRSGGDPASMRTAMYAGGDANQMAAGQGAELRAAEMQQAGQQYGDFMQGARTGDMALEAQRDNLIRQYTAAGMSAQDAQWQANMKLESDMAAQHQQAQATRAGVASSNTPSPWYGLGGAALGAAGAIGAGYMTGKD